MDHHHETYAALPAARTVVFDWDNTLVDTWSVIHAALTHTFDAMDLPPWTLAETKQRVSKSLRDSFPVLFGDRWEDAREIFYKRFSEIHLDDLNALPNAEPFLLRLRDAGVPMAIVSNKTGSFLRTEVSHLGWDSLFVSVVGAGDAVRDKPDTAALTMALNPVDRPEPANVWFIGDSRSDLELAQAARCTGVLVHPDYRSMREEFADCPPQAAASALFGVETLVFDSHCANLSICK